MLAILVAVSELAQTGSAWAAVDEHKRVLVLYSTRRDAEFSAIGEDELPKILDIGLGRDLDYYSEFIDVTRFPDPSYKTAFHDFLSRKYAGVTFDLIVAMQGAAIEFVSEQRDALFRDMPVVFLANDATTRRVANSTGVLHERNFSATVALIRQLQPEVEQIFVVTGTAASDRSYENAVRRQLQGLNEGPDVTYLSGLSSPDLQDRLSKLPARSAVYYVLVNEDGAGNKFHPLEYVDRVSAAANAPTYCWVDSAMDHGIVGGSLYSQRTAIQRVGEIAVRVLRTGQDTALAKAIQDKFAADRQVNAGSVEVTSKDGVVLLDGTLPNNAAKQRALTIAQRFLPMTALFFCARAQTEDCGTARQSGGRDREVLFARRGVIQAFDQILGASQVGFGRIW